jgi:hypothetical protein
MPCFVKIGKIETNKLLPVFAPYAGCRGATRYVP